VWIAIWLSKSRPEICCGVVGKFVQVQMALDSVSGAGAATVPGLE
jgi:hypothetical protein